LRVEAAPHGKVKVGVAAAASRGRLVYVLDRHRVRVTRRHAISLSVPRHRGSAPVWHRLAIRRAGSKRVLASTRFAVAARSSRRAPTLVLLDAPPAPSQPSDSKPPPIGSSVPGADGRRLLFEDDFSGTQLNTGSWSPYNGSGYNGHGLRRPYAITVDGQGHLVITAQVINGTVVTGGMSNRLNRPYGLYEFRVRTDPDPTHTVSGAVLTWPQSGRFPQDGENDIYETGTYYPRDPFYSFIHFGTTASSQTSYKHQANAADWHTMAMDWSSGAIKIYRDGALVWTVTDPAAIPDAAHHLAIQLDALGTGQVTGPVRMYVDWVRIYQ
jgi:beta-glucanase (GH16 family)